MQQLAARTGDTCMTGNYSEHQVLSVTDLTSLIKELLTTSFPRLSVEGEISNFRPASSGHWYFTLKDNDSAVSAVMFRNRQFLLDFIPTDGMRVVVSGKLSLYEKRGTYQIICESIQQAGEGAILAELERRKRRLQSEGLFDSSRKRPLPILPERVVVITASTGAALRDILQVLHRRNAGVQVRILPSLVQGEQAAATLSAAVRLANRHDLGDVIIIGRGGGSLEDLLPFSDEQVVRAVADSHIPVISAVGHEIDWALTDYAADLRAPTPSAAAELVTANREEVGERISMFTSSAAAMMQARLQHIRLQLAQFSPQAISERFQRTVEPHILHLDDSREQLIRSMQERLLALNHRLKVASSSLEAHSPKLILQRGYAIVRDEQDGNIIRSSGETGKGRNIAVTLSEGSITAEVQEVSS